MTKENTRTGSHLVGLGKYLEKYAAKHFPQMQFEKTFIDERGAFGLFGLTVNGSRYTVRLRIPQNAPPEPRPLLDSILLGDKVVWRFSLDYKPNVPWGEQRRIHLYQMEGVYAAAHVVAGSPFDVVDAVTRLNNKDFEPELAVLLRVQLARLWGMNTTITKPERKVLSRLQQKGLEA